MKLENNLNERKCTKKDFDFIYKIIKESLFPYIAEYFKPSKKKFTEGFDKDYKSIKIILNDKRRIGFYQLTPEKNSLDITKIFFAKKYRGKGLGSEFMKKFENLGYSKITLQVWENNPAVKFYKKLGYKIIKKQIHKMHMEKKIK